MSAPSPTRAELGSQLNAIDEQIRATERSIQQSEAEYIDTLRVEVAEGDAAVQGIARVAQYLEYTSLPGASVQRPPETEPHSLQARIPNLPLGRTDHRSRDKFEVETRWTLSDHAKGHKHFRIDQTREAVHNGTGRLLRFLGAGSANRFMMDTRYATEPAHHSGPRWKRWLRHPFKSIGQVAAPNVPQQMTRSEVTAMAAAEIQDRSQEAAGTYRRQTPDDMRQQAIDETLDRGRSASTDEVALVHADYDLHTEGASLGGSTEAGNESIGFADNMNDLALGVNETRRHTRESQLRTARDRNRSLRTLAPVLYEGDTQADADRLTTLDARATNEERASIHAFDTNDFNHITERLSPQDRRDRRNIMNQLQADMNANEALLRDNSLAAIASDPNQPNEVRQAARQQLLSPAQRGQYVNALLAPADRDDLNDSLYAIEQPLMQDYPEYERRFTDPVRRAITAHRQEISENEAWSHELEIMLGARELNTDLYRVQDNVPGTGPVANVTSEARAVLDTARRANNRYTNVLGMAAAVDAQFPAHGTRVPGKPTRPEVGAARAVQNARLGGDRPIGFTDQGEAGIHMGSVIQNMRYLATPGILPSVAKEKRAQLNVALEGLGLPHLSEADIVHWLDPANISDPDNPFPLGLAGPHMSPQWRQINSDPTQDYVPSMYGPMPNPLYRPDQIDANTINYLSRNENIIALRGLRKGTRPYQHTERRIAQHIAQNRHPVDRHAIMNVHRVLDQARPMLTDRAVTQTREGLREGDRTDESVETYLRLQRSRDAVQQAYNAHPGP